MKLVKLIIKIVFVIFVIRMLVYFIDFNFLKGEIYAYSLSCSKDKYVNGQCTEKWLLRVPKAYRPDIKNQRVFYWIGDSPEIKTLNKCSVVNRRNWTCKLDDASAELGFRSGNYWERSLITNSAVPDSLKVKYIPQWQHRLYEMKWW